MKATKSRFSESRKYILEFMNEYFVVCPRCEKCATVSVIEAGEMALFSPRRLTCAQCGYSAEWRGRSVSSRFTEVPLDWYFQRPFYYRADCCGHELWVFNRRHFDFLKEFVAAQIRSRTKSALGWSNRNLASRLPKWISAGKHRDKLLAALKKIEQRMEAP